MAKRTKLRDRKLPTYTKGEEIFNMVSHIIGGACGITAVVLCTVFAALHGNIYGIVSSAIFGASIIILYATSSIYHGLSSNLLAKKIFQIFDHCSIFVLIAGTYTPFCLCTLREYDPVTGWTIFGIIWTAAVIGILLNSIDIKKYKYFSMACYLIMGWCIIFRAGLLPELLGAGGLTLLLSGGIAYTVGAVFYGVGGKRRWMHSVFHIFCVVGTILHFLCVLFYVI